mmetsp:Transcript_36470/g.95231  ORF Transcript_36470/g.95231 Transcript_36470/m.95231 type:complete len:263 (+) Transcript_36470:537-1325(+)
MQLAPQDQEVVQLLSLAQRLVEPDHERRVHLVGQLQQEEARDAAVLDRVRLRLPMHLDRLLQELEVVLPPRRYDGDVRHPHERVARGSEARPQLELVLEALRRHLGAGGGRDEEADLVEHLGLTAYPGELVLQLQGNVAFAGVVHLAQVADGNLHAQLAAGHHAERVVPVELPLAPGPAVGGNWRLGQGHAEIPGEVRLQAREAALREAGEAEHADLVLEAQSQHALVAAALPPLGGNQVGPGLLDVAASAPAGPPAEQLLA